MKFTRIYLIVTGQVKATDDEAALIMQCVKASRAHLEESGLKDNIWYKDTFKSLEKITAETEDLP